ncbi:MULTISPECIES: ATP-binding protein [Halomonadaceae]|jgi:signal transduction histidine kinase|uniref:histidine kinase n=1 Tax=Vreelandella titanicae TaxID=664683 RepID=A0A653WG08_9GAMM|nr:MULTISPECIES: ATP-binding protein [Halomonas]QGQ72322.1 HAMP domain-containing protein [Halomonas sp. PA16-9]UEQ02881.1 HAMP domain-containing protein [Halomonas profundus]KIN15495.1 histidine kinase [Halomonas sp. KHS3]MCD1585093.1 HAMP domain-containing protein [Halomonas sp. IOP_14]MCE7520953.1 ATP-binding protein [Halomonas titanicae]|tara:strand:+ start:43756 stop:45201 length:1446 start_codon:yes stop_codon:yes gene_type:complete
MRLRNLIILTVIVPLFVILVVFSLVAIKSLEDNVRSKLQTEVEIITRTLSSSLSYAVTPDSNTPLEEALQSAFSFHRIYGAYVFDTQGRDIYGLGLGKDIFSREEIQQIIERDDLYSNYRQHDGWNYYSALTPLRSQDGTVYGVLQVNRLNTGIENYTGFISIVAVLVFVIGAAGIVFSIWWGFRRHIERPLNRLLHVMQLVEKGDRSQRATEDGPIEYRHLASGLNGMLDAMAEKDQEIENRQRREIELEKRLRKSKKLAELGVLAAGVAHEIGAPLTVINGQAQRLARRDVIGDDERARLGRIRGEVERIVEIVRQLMELGRQHNVEKGELALDQLIMNASDLVEDELEPRNIRLDIELPSPTPNLLANGQQIVQVLTNLLRNAAQAPEVNRIRVRAQQQEHELILWVEDDGPGIPSAHHHKVFDPFFTTKPVGQGSGLGLSMVHRIINDHGGTIGVFDSALGGAGFEITLPISETASA